MRVHELAKLLGTTSQKILERLHASGINAPNRLTDLRSTDIAQFREYESAKRQGKTYTPPKPEPVKTAPEKKPAQADPGKTGATKQAKTEPKPVAVVEPPPAVPTPTPAPEVKPAPAKIPAAPAPVVPIVTPADVVPTPPPAPAVPVVPAPVPVTPAPAIAATLPKVAPQVTEPAAVVTPRPPEAKQAPVTPKVFKSAVIAPPPAPKPVQPAVVTPPAKPVTPVKAAAVPAKPVHVPVTPKPHVPAPKSAAGGSPDAEPKSLHIPASVTVKELAELLQMRPNQIITDLMMLKVMTTINEKIDPKIAAKVAEKHGFVVEREKQRAEGPKPQIRRPDAELAEEPEKNEDMANRPPVVTVLGHVDHGKTSLLDKIRNTQVAKGEAGGITQHIGASIVNLRGKPITFLDTPGHEAFTAMRARGANMTDIAILVIAADDGIMPQTREAIKHVQAAKVTIMIAINKCDLPQANPTKVKQQLASEGLTPEDWGGNIICCEVSATTGKGIDHLLEMILLQAEILELKANPKRRARGFVIEARLEAGMGPTVNLLVQNGTLRVGDTLLCGSFWGRVRALLNDHGKQIKEAGPSTPVQCLGLPGVPEAGVDFRVCENDKAARNIAEARASHAKTESLTMPARASLDTLFQQIKDSGKAELRIVLKADTQGSLEAITYSLREIASAKVNLNIVLGGVGNITSNDVLLASASNAILFGFHVATDETVIRIAKQQGVEIRLHSIIYELIDQVRAAMTGLLPPTIKESVVGHAQVKQVFTISKGGVIAGCMCLDGYINMKLKVRVKRKGDVLFEGGIVSLRRFENDVSEVRESQECGIRLDNFAAFAEGDIMEFYQSEKIPQVL